MSSSFGIALRSKREKAGLTQDELARLAGVSQKHVSSLERGKNQPSWGMMETLAVALKLSVAELITRSL